MKKSISVATYNIELTKRPEQIIKNIIQLIEEGVTIFCLQEVLRVPGNSFVIDCLLEKLGHNWKAEYFVGSEINYLGHGTALLWNADILKVKTVQKVNLPKMNKLNFFDKLLERTAGFFGKPMQRRAISAIYSFDGIIIRVTSLHLDAVGGAENRRKQLRYLFSHLQQTEQINYEIICGDFNTSDFMNLRNEKEKMRNMFFQYGFMDASMNIPWSVDLYNIDFKNIEFDWKRNLLQIIIKKCNLHYYKKLDYIWTKGFTVVNANRINIFGSDHFPLNAVITPD